MYLMVVQICAKNEPKYRFIDLTEHISEKAVFFWPKNTLHDLNLHLEIEL